MELEEINLFLRIDDDGEKELIESLKLAAEEYLLNAGVEKDYSKELYKLAIKMLVSNWHENRNLVSTSSISKKMEYALGHILPQLLY